MAKRIISISCISILLLLFGSAGAIAAGEEQLAVDHGVNQGHQDPVAPSPDQPMDHSQMSVQEHSASGGDTAQNESGSHQETVDQPIDHSQMSAKDHDEAGTANDASGDHSAGSSASGGHGSSESGAINIGPDWPVIYGFAAINFLVLFAAAILKPRRVKAGEVL